MKTLQFALHTTVVQTAYIDIPDGISLEEAKRYANEHQYYIILDSKERVLSAEYVFDDADFVDEKETSI